VEETEGGAVRQVLLDETVELGQGFGRPVLAEVDLLPVEDHQAQVLGLVATIAWDAIGVHRSRLRTDCIAGEPYNQERLAGNASMH
jgi:hypothetical protein